MDPSLLVTWVLVPAAAGYALAAPSLLRRRHARQGLPRWTRLVDLPVPRDAGPTIASHLTARRVGCDVGGAAAVAVTALWGVTLGGGATISSWWPIVLLSSLFVGAAIGGAIGAFRAATRPIAGDAVRVARSTVARLEDYVAPLERWAARLVAVSPVVVLIAVLAAPNGAVVAGPVSAAAASVLVLAVAEVGARAVLRGRQPAGSDLELAWQDAIRAQALRSILGVPVAVGVYACAAALSALEPGQLDPRGAGAVALIASATLVIAAGAALLLWTNGPRPHQHFRQQLWPDAGPPLAPPVGEGR